MTAEQQGLRSKKLERPRTKTAEQQGREHRQNLTKIPETKKLSRCNKFAAVRSFKRTHETALTLRTTLFSKQQQNTRYTYRA
jgi:hypothetical protein